MPIAELDELDALIALGAAHLQAQRLLEVEVHGGRLPVWLLTLGSDDAAASAVAFVGGVHGLERIGSAVVLAWLRHLLTRLSWDRPLQAMLREVRLVFLPVVNPGGIALGTRANPQGVDLMRNAPVDAGGAPWLLGGHRLGPMLPWFRGVADAPMQDEAAALCGAIERELGGRRFSIAVDCHSGFGMRDRIWFPYAHTRTPIPQLAELHALTELFARSHPNHRYVCEPQSAQYLAHGDLWDHLHRRLSIDPERLFLPLTLEMGSWMWVRKNPRQLFSRHGMFNPQVGHREQRTLRRHLLWFDFLLHAAVSHAQWLPDASARADHQRRALALWYPEIAR